MSKHPLASLVNRIFATTFVMVILAPSFSVLFAFQDTQDSRIFGGPERKLYIGIPKRVPLKVNVRNLTGETWAHELERIIRSCQEQNIRLNHRKRKQEDGSNEELEKIGLNPDF